MAAAGGLRFGKDRTGIIFLIIYLNQVWTTQNHESRFTSFTDSLQEEKSEVPIRYICTPPSTAAASGANTRSALGTLNIPDPPPRELKIGVG
jgi:hypothetical protein